MVGGDDAGVPVLGSLAALSRPAILEVGSSSGDIRLRRTIRVADGTP